MSRISTTLALVVAASLVFAGLSAGCSFSPFGKSANSAPDGQADTMAPPPLGGANPKGGLKITPEVKPADVKPDPKPIGNDANDDGEIDRNERNAAANAYFQETVITYCRWMIGLVTLASIVALVLSFTKWSIMSAGKASYGFAVVAGIMVGQLALLKWGETLADIAGIATVASTIVAACMLGWYIVAFVKARIEVIRRKEIEEQAKQLAAEGHAREATALLSTVNPKVNDERSKVADTLARLDGMSKEERAKATAKLREWGITL